MTVCLKQSDCGQLKESASSASGQRKKVSRQTAQAV
jgi:hypothetical protein